MFSKFRKNCENYFQHKLNNYFYTFFSLYALACLSTVFFLLYICALSNLSLHNHSIVHESSPDGLEKGGAGCRYVPELDGSVSASGDHDATSQRQGGYALRSGASSVHLATETESKSPK